MPQKCDRDSIVAVFDAHVPFGAAVKWRCSCGFESSGDHRLHIADVLIGELGLDG